MTDKVKADMAYETLGGHRVNPKDGGLAYGGRPFKTYITDEGSSLTYVHEAMFDKDGLLGELDIANGNLHPATGLPRSSYTGVAMDYSTYDGEKNIEYVVMKGQAWLSGVYRGITPIPTSWGGNRSGDSEDLIRLATDEDKASFEVKISSGINIKVARKCMLFESIE